MVGDKMTHISNPITPRSTELTQLITSAKLRLIEIAEYMETADVCTLQTLNQSRDFWLTKLSEYEKERNELNNG